MWKTRCGLPSKSSRGASAGCAGWSSGRCGPAGGVIPRLAVGRALPCFGWTSSCLGPALLLRAAHGSASLAVKMSFTSCCSKPSHRRSKSSEFIGLSSCPEVRACCQHLHQEYPQAGQAVSRSSAMAGEAASSCDPVSAASCDPISSPVCSTASLCLSRPDLALWRRLGELRLAFSLLRLERAPPPLPLPPALLCVSPRWRGCIAKWALAAPLAGLGRASQLAPPLQERAWHLPCLVRRIVANSLEPNAAKPKQIFGALTRNGQLALFVFFCARLCSAKAPAFDLDERSPLTGSELAGAVLPLDCGRCRGTSGL